MPFQPFFEPAKGQEIGQKLEDPRYFSACLADAGTAFVGSSHVHMIYHLGIIPFTKNRENIHQSKVQQNKHLLPMSKCGFPVSQNGFHPGHSRTARLWLLRLFVTGLLTTFALHWALAGKLWIKSSDFQKNKQTNSFLGFWSCVVVSVGLCFGSSLIVLFIYIYICIQCIKEERSSKSPGGVVAVW